MRRSQIFQQVSNIGTSRISLVRLNFNPILKSANELTSDFFEKTKIIGWRSNEASQRGLLMKIGAFYGRVYGARLWSAFMDAFMETSLTLLIYHFSDFHLFQDKKLILFWSGRWWKSYHKKFKKFYSWKEQTKIPYILNMKFL